MVEAAVGQGRLLQRVALVVFGEQEDVGHVERVDALPEVFFAVQLEPGKLQNVRGERDGHGRKTSKLKIAGQMFCNLSYQFHPVLHICICIG